MSLVFHILLAILLVLIFFQDWKYRAVTWYLFPLLALMTILIFLLRGQDWKTIGSNLLFIVVVMLLLVAFIALREKKVVNIFRSHFGIGDVLFLVAVTPLFAHRNFILFFISGMLLAGLVHLVIRFRVIEKTIPLAGYLALYVLLLKSVSVLVDVDLLNSNGVRGECNKRNIAGAGTSAAYLGRDGVELWYCSG